jgi:hypothetical protein
MCRYIVGKIIWEEMQKYTDIQMPEMDDKIEKHRIITKRCWQKNKKCSEIQAFFSYY